MQIFNTLLKFVLTIIVILFVISIQVNSMPIHSTTLPPKESTIYGVDDVQDLVNNLNVEFANKSSTTSPPTVYGIYDILNVIYYYQSVYR